MGYKTLIHTYGLVIGIRLSDRIVFFSLVVICFVNKRPGPEDRDDDIPLSQMC